MSEQIRKIFRIQKISNQFESYIVDARCLRYIAFAAYNSSTQS